MKKEMEEFERRFAALLSGSTLPMDEVLRHVGTVSGKRLRPRLVFLSAGLLGEVNDAARRTAMFVETLHTATLIHDDVVDQSVTRRGQASVHARWDNMTAVLAGDYLLSKAMLQLADPSDHLILKEMLTATLAMSEGELLQLRGEHGAVQNYLDIITRKTAMLIRACCVGGALAAMGEKTEDRSQKTELVGEFGLNLGLVFQMRDDILDHDDAETSALAEKMLPEYLDKALKALDTLAPYAVNAEALASLRELTVFCAKRNG